MAQPSAKQGWSFSDLQDTAVVAEAGHHTAASLFDRPGHASMDDDKSRWAGIHVLKSHWKGYFKLQMVDQNLVSQASIDIHHSEIDKFRNGAEQLRRGAPLTIQLSHLAEFKVDGKAEAAPQHARALLLEPGVGSGNGKVSVISSDFETLWKGEVRPLHLSKVLSEISKEALQISDASPRRSLVSRSSAEMPESWQRQAERLQVSGSPVSKQAFSSDGVSVELRGTPVKLPQTSIGASKLEVRVDEWPPILEIEYVQDGTSRRHARVFKAEDLRAMQETIRAPHWSLSADASVTMDLKPAQRPAVFEAIRAVVDIYGERFDGSIRPVKASSMGAAVERMWV